MPWRTFQINGCGWWSTSGWASPWSIRVLQIYSGVWITKSKLYPYYKTVMHISAHDAMYVVILYACIAGLCYQVLHIYLLYMCLLMFTCKALFQVCRQLFMWYISRARLFRRSTDIYCQATFNIDGCCWPIRWSWKVNMGQQSTHSTVMYFFNRSA